MQTDPQFSALLRKEMTAAKNVTMMTIVIPEETRARPAQAADNAS